MIAPDVVLISFTAAFFHTPMNPVNSSSASKHLKPLLHMLKQISGWRLGGGEKRLQAERKRNEQKWDGKTQKQVSCVGLVVG